MPQCKPNLPLTPTLCCCPLAQARHRGHIHELPSHLSSVTEPPQILCGAPTSFPLTLGIEQHPHLFCPEPLTLGLRRLYEHCILCTFWNLLCRLVERNRVLFPCFTFLLLSFFFSHYLNFWAPRAELRSQGPDRRRSCPSGPLVVSEAGLLVETFSASHLPPLAHPWPQVAMRGHV